MATDIVGSLFGVDPTAYQQGRDKLAYAQDYQAVQLDPLQQANLALRQGGRGLAQAAGGLMGMQDPELAKASQIKQLSTQFDLSTPTGLRQFAAALQPFAPEEAIRAAQVADQREQTGLGLQKTRADIAISERKVSQDEKLREALAALPSNATDEQYLQVFRQFGSPDQQARAIEAAMARRAKGAGDGTGVGAPGPVGKTGAYRDITGQVLGPTEMKTVRSEFETNQRLLNTLNAVSAKDVKDAESFVDWTTKGESKALASKATLNAQSKIAASQLLEQINQLPPGSASDADMRAAMKSFPGYSDPDALAQWVNRTKERLQFHIGRTSDQFGFKPTVTASAPIDLTKKAAKPGSSRENPIKLD